MEESTAATSRLTRDGAGPGPLLRAHQALKAAGLTGRPVRAPNSSNEVWFVGRYVLRVNPSFNRRNDLAHLRAVLDTLAGLVPVPDVIGYDDAPFGEWLIVRRSPGQELSRAWPAMTEGERERAVRSLGEALRRTHQVDAAAERLGGSPDGIERRLSTPHQLPAARLSELLDLAAQLPGVDPAVIVAAGRLVDASGDALDGPANALIHGDLHFENVLWDGTELTGIIDWEFARPGPPDLDLDVLLHALVEPALHVAADYAEAVHPRDFANVAGWLRSAYPELFAHPRLVERLTLYRLSYETRALLQAPPTGSGPLPAAHPYRRLQRLVERPDDLRWLLLS